MIRQLPPPRYCDGFAHSGTSPADPGLALRHAAGITHPPHGWYWATRWWCPGGPPADMPPPADVT